MENTAVKLQPYSPFNTTCLSPLDGVDPDLIDQVGIPSHCIQLKVDDIVMCMRNLATSDGLIVVKIHFKERLIECITLQSNTNGARTRFFIPEFIFNWKYREMLLTADSIH